MKHLLSCLFFFVSLMLNAQVEITNLDEVVIDDESSMQSITIDVMNVSTDTVNLDWVVEYKNNSESFLKISVSDITMSYVPSVLTTCDIPSSSNVLPPSDSYPMGLFFIFDEIPSTFPVDSTLAFFYLYSAGECTEEAIIKLPIVLDNTISSVTHVEESPQISLYPNPARHSITLKSDVDLNMLNFEIFDLQLQLVLNGRFARNKIDISTLPTGQYILKTRNQSLLFVKEE